MSDTDDVWSSVLKKWTEESGRKLEDIMQPLPRDHKPPRLADITGLPGDEGADPHGDLCRTCPKREDIDSVSGPCCLDEPVSGAPVANEEPWRPLLWSKRPDSVTHIAAPAMHIFGMYIRQRCAWCGAILLEYDLNRVAVPVGTDPTPATWAPMVMVRVDGHMSSEVEAVEEDGNIKLPMDSCTFDPETQVR